MPIYEYLCSKCGEFEVMQRITDKALTKCPSCKAKVTKLMSNTSFHLKGSGWYVTDYARSGSGAGKGKDAQTGDSTTSESKSESKSEPKSESASKSETKSETKPKASSEGKGKQVAAA